MSQTLDKATVEAFVARMNGSPRASIPAYYRGVAKRVNEALGRQNTTTSLTDEQIYELDQFVAQSYFENRPMAALLGPVTQFLRNPRWEIKYYEFEDGDEKNFLPDIVSGGHPGFKNLKTAKGGVKPANFNAMGFGVRVDIPWTLMGEAGGGVYDPEFWHTKKLIDYFSVADDRSDLLGSAGYNLTPDIGYKGLQNTTSIAEVGIGAGADNDLTADGDVDRMHDQIASSLRSCKAPGPNVIVSTSGVASELLLHDSSYTDRTAYEKVQKKWYDSGVFSKWIVDDNILAAAAPAVGTQRVLAFRLSPDVIRKYIVYPLQRKPIQNREFADDVAFAYISAKAIKIVDLTGVVKAYAGASDNVTTTNAGFVRNGTFMTGSMPADGSAAATPPITPTFYA